jgi:hypothetical protein
MKPIVHEELLSLADYERVRARLRPLFIHEKERRRLAVGSHLTLLFENAQTVWYQIQEMIRTEKIQSAEAIAHEIETYNELLPGAEYLSATMLIEYPDPAHRDAALRRLVGLENHVWIVVGDRRERAIFDTRQMGADRISSVQFVRFPVGRIEPDAFLGLAESGKVAIEVDHPSMAGHAAIAGLLARALAEDLAAA